MWETDLTVSIMNGANHNCEQMVYTIFPDGTIGVDY